MGKLSHKLGLGLGFIFIVGVILFVNYYPHYYGLINTPDHYSYSGQASWFDPWDINNYFATIKLAQIDRSVFLSNINTTEHIKPAFIYPLYTISAILFPNINNIMLYHILAIVCGIALATGIFVFSQLILKKYLYSFYSLILISLGGGLGFLFSSPEVSADLQVPGVTFLSNFQKPHEAVAALLYMSSLLFFYLSVEKKRVFYLLLSILSFILLIPIYPYRLLSFFFITSIFTFYTFVRIQNKYPFMYLGVFSIVIFPLTLFYIFHFLHSGFSVLTNYEPHRITFSSLFLGYGFFILFFLYQLFWIKNKTPLIWFLNFWILVSMSLSLLPFGISRLYISGLLFPMSLLLVNFLKNHFRHSQLPAVFMMLVVLILILPTSVYTFNKRTAEVYNNNIWFYIPTSFQQSLDFLEDSKTDGVLALPPLSSYIPAQTGKHVYFGIKDQSPQYDEKLKVAETFYSGAMTEKEAKSFLDQNDINMVAVAVEEDKSNRLSYPFLTVVYANEEVEILKK